MAFNAKTYKTYAYRTKEGQELGVLSARLTVKHGALVFHDRNDALLLLVAPGQWIDLWEVVEQDA